MPTLFRIRLLLALVAMLPAAAAAAGEYPYRLAGIDAVVLEEGTNQPVDGVRLLADWARDVGGFHGSVHLCDGMSIATSGADGQFHMNAPERAVVKDPLSSQTALRAHKPGWEEILTLRDIRLVDVTPDARQPRMREQRGRIVMKRVAGSRTERLQYLLKLTESQGRCSYEPRQARDAKPFFESVAAEGRAIAAEGWEQSAARVLALRASRPGDLRWDEEQRIFEGRRDPPPEGAADESHAMFLKSIHDADLPAVAAAVARGADVNWIGYQQRTVLTVALDEYYGAVADSSPTRTDRWKIVQVLLATPGIEVDRSGVDRHAPLMLALEKENLEAVQALLEAGADQNLVNGESPMAFALKQHGMSRTSQDRQRIDVLFRTMLRHPRTRLDALGTANWPLLCTAIWGQWPDTMRALLVAGADPNVRCAGEYGSPALQAAVSIASSLRYDEEQGPKIVALLANWPAVDPDTLDKAILTARMVKRPQLEEILVAARSKRRART